MENNTSGQGKEAEVPIEIQGCNNWGQIKVYNDKSINAYLTLLL